MIYSKFKENIEIYMRDYHLNFKDAKTMALRELQIHREVRKNPVKRARSSPDVLKNLCITIKVPAVFHEILEKIYGKHIPFHKILALNQRLKGK